MKLLNRNQKNEFLKEIEKDCKNSYFIFINGFVVFREFFDDDKYILYINEIITEIGDEKIEYYYKIIINTGEIISIR